MLFFEIVALSALVLGFLSLMVCYVFHAIKLEKRKEKQRERFIRAFEKIAGVDGEKETK